MPADIDLRGIVAEASLAAVLWMFAAYEAGTIITL
jgi:hypothetical protein